MYKRQINGQTEKSITGKALENPFNAVVWIAEFLKNRGLELKEGQIIMTGSTFSTYFPENGDTIEYEVCNVGSVKIKIN